ncbi:hypothetical protein [Cellulomonas sp. URHE0023]|uniref:hypothetical protein n=1 Tax=Cellulomonas sp. URHE0023 TaxID=1380354 RepID=UPI0004816681|nr:hypothetical protein [Cellulomonas sp. URHE0023]
MTAQGRALDAFPRARRSVLPLAALGVLSLFTATVAAQGRVVLHDCVSPGGTFGALGLRLAVLQDVTDCPEGSYGLGGVSRGAVLLLSVALPVLVGYALLTAGGVGVSALLVRAVLQARAILVAVLPQLMTDASPVPGGLRATVPAGRPPVPRTRVMVGCIARRGPPPAAA